MGRHSKAKHQNQQAPRDMMDIRTSESHLLTPDAAAAGRLGGERYIALCGADVIPASMVEPGSGYCEPCRAAVIPAQKSRGSRR